MADDGAQVELNGVDLETLTELMAEVDRDSDRLDELSDYSRSCRVRWLNSFHSQAFTRDVPPNEMDEPEWLGGTNQGMAASEAVLGAIGGCIATGFAANASVRDVEINELEVDVEGEINLPSFFGLSGESPGYESVDVTIYADCDADDDLLEEIAFRAVDLSPVVNTVREPVDVDYEVKDTG
ncbi:MAG: OsmC family protein [Halobacteriales archaeon]